MAQSGYKIDFIVRDLGADISDLLKIHQKQFPNNELAVWKYKDKIIVKVANVGEVSGADLKTAKDSIGYVEPIRQGA